MRSRGTISVYHYDDKSEKWTVSYLPFFSLCCRRGAEKMSGFLFKNYCVIRAFLSDADLFIGDYVFIGRAQAAEPNISLCLKITALTTNERGKNPHFKIICE